MNYLTISKEMKKMATPARAKANAWFFKTGKGQYGEGDQFIGLSVPQLRIIAKKYRDISFKEISLLMKSKIHEERLIAVYLLVYQFEKADEATQKKIYDFYLKNTKYVNNWDIVDTSAGYIVGGYLFTHPREIKILDKLAVSQDLWEKRIAIVATYAFIQKGKDALTHKIAIKLMNDKHDLIHKAVGWMLREAGKKVSLENEKKFLDKYAHKMPRTMLRYAIELFPQEVRKYYLTK